MHVIGIDWAATDEAKCGLSLGHVRDGAIEIVELLTGREAESRRSAPHVAEWLRSYPDALVAVDAPLGWPSRLARGVSTHAAGAPLGKIGDASLFFSRETDRFVRQTFKKSPLEVGADRIARTAFSALCLLEELRDASGLHLTLSWAPSERGVIEVYPAATLKVLTAPQKVAPYKRPEQVDARRAILDGLAARVRMSPAHAASAIATDHLLDAVLCVVAGADFAAGEALAPPPELLEAARREGWIWVRDPREVTASAL